MKFAFLALLMIQIGFAQTFFVGSSQGPTLEQDFNFSTLSIGVTQPGNDELTRNSYFLEFGNDKANVSAASGLVNILVEIEYLHLNFAQQYRLSENSWLELGLGAGLAKTKGDTTLFGNTRSYSSNALSAQAFARTGFTLSHGLSTYAGAKFVYLSETHFGAVSYEGISDFILEVGLRWSF